MSDSIEPYHGEGAEDIKAPKPQAPRPRRERTIEEMLGGDGKWVTFRWQGLNQDSEFTSKWGHWNDAVDKHDGLDMYILNHGVRGVRVRMENYGSDNWEIVEVGYPLGSFGPGTEWVVVVDSEFDGGVYAYETEEQARAAMDQRSWWEPKVYLAKVISKEQEHGEEEEAKA